MKKLLLMFALMCGVMFTSCGGATKNAEQVDSTKVDTTAVNPVAIDTLSTDTLAVDSLQ